MRVFSENIQIPEKVPVFPLPNVILFPGIDLPLYIFEPRYRKMLADCSAGHKFMAISLLKQGWEVSWKDPAPSYDVVGVGYVRAIFENPDGTSHILLKGVGRAKILRYTKTEPYRLAKVMALPDKIENEHELEKLTKQLKKLVFQKLRFASENPHEPISFSKEFQNPVTLSYLACFFAQANPYLKQNLLEIASCDGRIRNLIDIFKTEIHPTGSQN